MADKFAKVGAEMPMNGLEPYLEAPKTTATKNMQDQMDHNSKLSGTKRVAKDKRNF